MMDLSSSSEVDLEENPKPKANEDNDSSDAYVEKKFKTYVDDESDDGFEDNSGWQPKKATSLKGVRSGSVGLKDTSPRSLSARNAGRRTTARL